MPWNQKRFEYAWRAGVPAKVAIRCGLVYFLSRLVWIIARHHFQVTAAQQAENIAYLTLETAIFIPILMGRRQITQLFRQWRLNRSLNKGNL